MLVHTVRVEQSLSQNISLKFYQQNKYLNYFRCLKFIFKNQSAFFGNL